MERQSVDEKQLNKILDRWDLKDPKLVAQTFTSNVYWVTTDQGHSALKILNETGQRKDRLIDSF